MNMSTDMLIVLIWICAGYATYKILMKDWKQTVLKKIWLSSLWPFTCLFYGMHYFYNKVWLKKK